MDQRNLLTYALEFIKMQRQYRWWLRAVTGMAVLGEVIKTEIFALADDGREETYFVLTADGDNAGLDESRLDFESEGIASIEDENGQGIDLHREYTEAGAARYWFVMQEGQSASFSLPWINGIDRYRAEEIAEEIPGEPGNPEQAGAVTVTFGTGADLEKACNNANRCRSQRKSRGCPPTRMNR